MFFDQLDFDWNTNIFRRRAGPGSTIKVTVPAIPQKDLTITIERKIIAGDVVNGKLKSAACERPKRRGGKRSLSINLSEEATLELHAALTSAVGLIRRRNFTYKLFCIIFDSVTQMVGIKDHK